MKTRNLILALTVVVITVVASVLLIQNNPIRSSGDRISPVAGRTEVASVLQDLYQRHSGVMARANAVVKELERSEKAGQPFPVPTMQKVIHLGTKALQMKLYTLKNTQLKAINAQSPEIDFIKERNDSVYADLLDAYVFYVAGVHGLNVMAHRMKATVGKDELLSMKMVSAMNVSRKYGKSLKAGWVEFGNGRQLASKEFTDFQNFRDWIVYDWKTKFSHQDRLKIAKGSHTYFDKIFPKESMAWAERLLKEMPEAAQQQKKGLALDKVGMRPEEKLLITSLEELFQP